MVQAWGWAWAWVLASVLVQALVLGLVGELVDVDQVWEVVWEMAEVAEVAVGHEKTRRLSSQRHRTRQLWQTQQYDHSKCNPKNQYPESGP